jgi:hypothetical protein
MVEALRIEPGIRSGTEETASEVEPWSSEGVQLWKFQSHFALTHFVVTSFNVPFKHR